MRSPQPTSAMEPSETIELKPAPSRRLQSRMAVMSAPDWPMKLTRPLLAMPAANVALRPDMGLITPRQLGPMMRMPYSLALATRSRSSLAPSSPTSLKPAEMTTAVGTPASPHSSMMPGIDTAGVTMTARSTFSGMDAMLLWAWMPRTLGRLGLTG